MTSNPGTIAPQMLAYLGPRMQAVHVLVTAQDATALKSVWPPAKRALICQEIDEDDVYKLSVPKVDAGVEQVDQFKRHILTMAKPSFTRSVQRIVDAPHITGIVEDVSTIFRREMIEVGAMLAYAESGIVERSVVEKFIEAVDRINAVYQYDTPLMDDLRKINRHLENPDAEAETWDQDIFDRYTEAFHRQGYDVWGDYFHGSSYYADPGHRVDVAWYRAGVIEIIRPEIERRLMFEVLSASPVYTQEEVQQIYDWGFISAQLYGVLRRHTR